jgi:UDP-N-acetylmuramyl pentapeptide phosphotransferase/UDP-N-acetylglucosamine-1-phosphate transferase
VTAAYLLFLGLPAFILSYAGVALIRGWALRRNLLDIPNERSSHAVPTPRGGGLVIVIVVLTGFVLTLFVGAGLPLISCIAYLLGALIIAAISGVDDLFKVSAKARLPIHFLAAAVFVALTGFVNRPYLPFIGELDWGWLGIPISLLWIVGFTNAFNFMDGIDSIAAGQAIVAGVLWMLVSAFLNMSALATLSILVIGASLGFLLHNTPPARIFMGDVGSTVLGYTFATLPILGYTQTGNSRLFVVGVLCVAPFAFDTALTMLRRAVNRENVLQAHRSHLYQRLVKLGYHHGSVGLFYTGLAFLSSIMGLVYLWGSDRDGGLALLAVILLLLATGVGVTWLEYRHLEGAKPSRSLSRRESR